jgi:hypothetical protein
LETTARSLLQQQADLADRLTGIEIVLQELYRSSADPKVALARLRVKAGLLRLKGKPCAYRSFVIPRNEVADAQVLFPFGGGHSSSGSHRRTIARTTKKQSPTAALSPTELTPRNRKWPGKGTTSRSLMKPLRKLPGLRSRQRRCFLARIIDSVVVVIGAGHSYHLVNHGSSHDRGDDPLYRDMFELLQDIPVDRHASLSRDRRQVRRTRAFPTDDGMRGDLPNVGTLYADRYAASQAHLQRVRRDLRRVRQ